MPIADRRGSQIGRRLEPVGIEELEQRIEHEQWLAGVVLRLLVGADDVVGGERESHAARQPNAARRGDALLNNW